MKPFTRHTGTIATLDRNNVDTDAIMPKQFMQSLERTGYGRFTFDEWRYLDRGDLNSLQEDRKPNPLFELNDPRFQGATVLITRQNFGCGSSREHAVWGLNEYGFKVIIAESFADIFYNNCVKNGLLPIILQPKTIGKLINIVKRNTTSTSIQIDLQLQAIRFKKYQIEFFLPSFHKEILLTGADDITETLKHRKEISTFEDARRISYPWLYQEDNFSIEQ
ncbi:3-isopropylmalate dehydratase small subunit [Pseudomonas mediterranea]|uniref:3-isopropylmalate dehydratase small subunit n=1 Tax=Pseudomonas TaxID=286 RepID=UPI0013183C15|nr:3-isopropylmalate dehydratase small subunit [Pseudomonas mediterranea]QHA82186.1 3-isopropylmalate dehydratase small subunit [Pseudomonas mediterranea]